MFLINCEFRMSIGVIDIDVADANNPQLCAEYAPQIYAYLRQLESDCTVKEDFLAGLPFPSPVMGRSFFPNLVINCYCYLHLPHH